MQKVADINNKRKENIKKIIDLVIESDVAEVLEELTDLSDLSVKHLLREMSKHNNMGYKLSTSNVKSLIIDNYLFVETTITELELRHFDLEDLNYIAERVTLKNT